MRLTRVRHRTATEQEREGGALVLVGEEGKRENGREEGEGEEEDWWAQGGGVKWSFHQPV
jgi:hypothetical protein